ncbi:MAG: hypothetical protein AAF907_02455 [Planctomycetota bacterium]
MSRKLFVFAAYEPELRQILGAGDAAVVTGINEEYRSEFDDFREDDDDWDHAAFTYEDAVVDLIDGRPVREGALWPLYGYAIEAILCVYGEVVGEVDRYGRAFEERYTAALQELGTTLDFATLSGVGEYRNLFSDSQGDPDWGCWGTETCRAAAETLRDADLSADPTEKRRLEEIRRWVQTAADEGDFLIGMVL